MDKLEELKMEIEKLEGGEKCKANLWKGDLFLNCDDGQAVSWNGKEYEFSTIGRSRFFHSEKFEDAKECAKFCIKIAQKSSDDINKEYRAIFDGLTE